MFIAKADVNRCFFGIIKRGKDEDDNSYVFSRIKMQDVFLCASANDQKILGNNLDKICVMILDKGLHNDCGVTKEIFGTDFFLN
jgi:hypothetical protein